MEHPNFGQQFSENLALLPAPTASAVELSDTQGVSAGRIENKPGQAGSLRVYLWLEQTFGTITPEAAQLGLRIYAEHTEDARLNPGKHPNIDRLLSIRNASETLKVQVL